MSSFRDANQVRLITKMKYSNYAWYKSSTVISEADGYAVIVGVKKLDNQIRKLISPVVMGVGVRSEVEL